MKEFTQLDWNEQIADDCRQLVRLAVREDLDRSYDLTTMALVPDSGRGRTRIVSREAGVLAGVRAAQVACDEMDVDFTWSDELPDGSTLVPGQAIATLAGSVRDLLTTERLVLNLIGRLSGIATLTRRFVEKIAGTRARIYDTRKTTPGWRRLEKYAVRCGGGTNHRTGLFDAVLIKDNHLAFGGQQHDATGYTPAEAVLRARRFLTEMFGDKSAAMLVEVEVDSLADFDEVLAAGPDIVLLDNMQPEMLREAVSRRDAAGVAVELEASGGVNLQTVRAIAETGVERISVGALTHSAIALDVGLDWDA